MILGATIRLKDQFTTTMSKVAKGTRTFKKESETATTTVSKLTSKIKVLGKTVARPVIKIKDQATSSIKKIKDSLVSLKGFAAVALAGMGLGAVGGATLGAAMKKEQQMVSMEHFIGTQNKGMSEAEVKKQSQQYVGWLNKYANKTPFETGEIISGGARAVNVSGGDVAKAREIMKIAGDMAALNPEKTFSDAMEALADLKVGETERMKEFGFKITQEDIKTAGGAENVMTGQVASFFKGGAEKLSTTGAGLWSTIKGQMSTNFATAGEGILEGLKPQLQWLADYFDKRGPALENKAKNIGQSIGNAITTIRPIIQGIRDFIRPGVAWVKEQIPAVKSMWETAWPTISSVLSTAWSIAQPIFSVIVDTIKIVWGLFEKAWPVISGVVETAWSIMKPIFDALGKGLTLVAKGVKWVAEKFDAKPSEVKVASKSVPKPKGKASGLSYVPYDNYSALLHRGEAVLPRRDADHYRAGNSGITIAKLADTIVVREDADIDRIANAVVYKIIQADLNYGGAG
jgi:phage-related protein